MNMIRNQKQLKSINYIYRINKQSTIKYWFVGIIAFLCFILLLPWTQNIKAKGLVTTQYQNQRPQEINSPIPGKIVKWWVKEGDIVKKGDTILQLSEIKVEYLDPLLIDKMKAQLDAKKGSLNSYAGKVSTIDQQLDALNKSKSLKLAQIQNKMLQLENKLKGENAELEAAENELKLSKDQFTRQQKLYNDGLVSQTQLQQRNIAYQNALAKKIVIENKLAQTQQEILNIKLEELHINQDYNEKISKIEGERFSNIGQIATTEGELAKLENTYTSYVIRNGMYILLAPQDGQIAQSKKSGIGEIIKEGEHITLIIPTDVNHAVELFVRPADLPLLHVNQKVRFLFDGFPAIVFSGWPDNSYGTFGGRVFAIENSISPNGLFRVLVCEDPNDKPWPKLLKIGSGAQGMALIKDVPIWYELWRNINGFPPDFYTDDETQNKQKKSK
ncbi:MAG: HlyD family efflux transporter periplasmic adaptor subunit [Bacteroidetes bacterium]|nr:HlyD family efflux transporter periplasmic adaptor subunit [Bacteroidota bacterium]